MKGQVKSETEEMMMHYTVMKHIASLLAIGLFLVSLGFAGNIGVGLASNETGLLQIHQDQVTGSVMQLPLQIILDQLQQLGIEYTAPTEALETRVSVDLQQESIARALAKILAPWDYALKMDPAGTIQEIFVVQKIPAAGPEDQTIKEEYNRRISSRFTRVSKRPRIYMGEQQGALKEEIAVGSLPFGTSRPVIQQEPPEIPEIDEGNFWDALGEAGMEYIPPTGYPEMEVTPASEEEKQAILRSMAGPLP